MSDRKELVPLPQITEIQLTIKTTKEPNWSDAEGAWLACLTMLLASAEATAWSARQVYDNGLVKDFEARPVIEDRRRPEAVK